MDEIKNIIDFSDDFSSGIDRASPEEMQEAMNAYRETIRNYILFEEREVR